VRRATTDGAAPSLFVVTDLRRRGAQVAAGEIERTLQSRGRATRRVALADSPSVGAAPRVDAPVLGRSRLGAGTLRALRAEIAGAAAVVGFGSTTLPAVAAAGLGTGVPFVYVSIGDLPFWAGRLDRKVRVRAALRRCQAVVVLWDAAARPVVEDFGVPAARVRVIPTGVDAGRFPPADGEARRAARQLLGLPLDATVVGWVGALSEEKRPELAVRTAAELPADHVLAVAGDGPLRDAVVRLAGEVAPGRVRLLGSLADTAPVYAAADATLLTSRSEGMPGTLIEAGLSGRPAVTTAVGGAGEVVAHGETGMVVPVTASPAELADAVRTAVDCAEALGAAARRRCAERYELQRVVDAWDELLAELVQRRSDVR
jgi:glycosyltransferase involved in cell wall biosynthesis